MEQLNKDIDNHLASEEYKQNEAEAWELRCLSLKTVEEIFKALTEVIGVEDAIDIMLNSNETKVKILNEISEHPTYKEHNGYVTDTFLRHWILQYKPEKYDTDVIFEFLDMQIEKLQGLKKDIQSEDLTRLNNSDYEDDEDYSGKRYFNDRDLDDNKIIGGA